MSAYSSLMKSQYKAILIFLFFFFVQAWWAILAGLYEYTGRAIALFLTLVVSGRIAQSVGHLTCKSEVLGSIPSLATYFRFSFR